MFKFHEDLRAWSLTNLENVCFIWKYRWSHCGIGLCYPFQKITHMGANENVQEKHLKKPVNLKKKVVLLQ